MVLVAALTCVLPLVGCGAPMASGPAVSAPTVTASPSATPSAVPPTAAITVPVAGAGLDQQIPIAVAPVRIRIPAIGVDMSVQPEGLADTGAMALPPDPADAAWYRYGSWPGSAGGATVIAAHVDSLDYDIGPLARLPEVVAGTEMIVTTEEGREISYLVQAEGMVRKTDVDWPAVFDRSGPPRLTIVTCGGEFDYDRRTYLENVVVTALPQG